MSVGTSRSLTQRRTHAKKRRTRPREWCCVCRRCCV
jgi:hypothetical protein